MTATPGHRYDEIGLGYAGRRRPDPRIGAAVHDALGDARTVVNVGAGAGSYEPTDRPVVAIEPSRAMAVQRPPTATPAVLGSAEELPLADASVDAGLAVLTMHHWGDLARGLRELARVARRRIVTLTIDVEVEADMWLFRDYIPEVAERDRQEFPALDAIADVLGGRTRVVTVPVPADCTDGFLISFWSRPETVLDAVARAATSGFARMDDATEAAAVHRLTDDLASGAWDRSNGELRTLPSLDVGLRLTVTELD